jgi:hypothetical protein
MNNKLTWHTLEYKKKERTTDWYWAVGIISLCIVVIAIILHDALFALLVIIAVGALMIFSIREPRIVEIELNDRGLRVNKELYPFVSLDSFWVDIMDERNPKIIIRSKKIMVPLIVVPIEEYNHEDIRNVLLEKLAEKEMHEPLSQKIMEGLGF